MVGGDGRLVHNRDQPRDVPTRPMGDIPVIVRVQWADGLEEWRPARANRWTATHVFVCWRDDPTDARTERYEWLRAGDVVRSATWLVPPAPARPRGGADRPAPGPRAR